MQGGGVPSRPLSNLVQLCPIFHALPVRSEPRLAPGKGALDYPDLLSPGRRDRPDRHLVRWEAVRPRRWYPGCTPSVRTLRYAFDFLRRLNGSPPGSYGGDTHAPTRLCAPRVILPHLSKELRRAKRGTRLRNQAGPTGQDPPSVPIPFGLREVTTLRGTPGSIGVTARRACPTGCFRRLCLNVCLNTSDS